MMQAPADSGIAPPPPPPPPPQPNHHQWMMQPGGVPPPVQPGALPPPVLQAQQRGGATVQSSGGHPGGELKTLWVGDLQYWMDEAYLYSCFARSEVQVAKVIRNKQTGYSEGYGFVEFANHGAAEKVLQSQHGLFMPSTEIPFRLNWACFGIGERRPDQGPDFSIFVGDLAPDVTDQVLQETFQSRYPSVKGAKVVMDTTTARSKGYGFVRFGDESEKSRAMAEMNGVYCSSRPMRISTATPKKSLGSIQPKVFYPGQNFGPVPPLTDNDPTNTTVFVGGLDHNVKDEDLKQVFSRFGEILYVKIPAGKGCGFVQFTTRASAEEALQKLHGSTIGQQTIRLSWGRSPASKQRAMPGWGQVHPEFNHWNGAYYGYGQGYECYGFAPPPQDPAAYGYGNFQQAYGHYPQQVS